MSISTELKDDAWDDFLLGNRLGQFQQSAMWAQTKAVEGWRPIRITWRSGDNIQGGFQILWRPSRLGRIGYISKGPVLASEEVDNFRAAIEHVKTALHKNSIRALILQPPDESRIAATKLQACGFQPNHFRRIIDTTLIVNVSGGRDAIDRRMSRSARQNAHQALRRGVVVREAGRGDVPTFFRLMLETCRRQNTSPNPPTEVCAMALWDAFHVRKAARLTLAEASGEVLAGLLCIPFGTRLNIWKKGWSTLRGDLHPNELLYYDALHWAGAQGYEFCDFAALDRDIALALTKGEELSEAQRKTRHCFNIRFGGCPRFLPPAVIHFPNPAVRFLYRLYAVCPWMLQRLKGT